ncbi:MAG: zinc ribbon domain-containing protein [Thermoplasmata archaeon]|nr:MAG: zinc ribbon domain-containing protein [Thermoplasmata archaeon]
MKSATTKLPCEVIIWYVIPDLRNEISRILLEDYNYKQVEIARLLGVTKAAVNQYLSSKRGENFFSLVKDKKTKNMLLKEVRKSVATLVDDKTTIDIELCRMCNIIKGNKIIFKVYDKYVHTDVPECLAEFGEVSTTPTRSTKSGKQLKCPSCRKQVQNDWVVCPYCSEKLALKCAGCKAMVEISWKNCPYCARKIPAKKSKKSSKKK